MKRHEIERLYEKADLNSEELSSLWEALMEKIIFFRGMRLGPRSQDVFLKYVAMLDDVEREMVKRDLKEGFANEQLVP